MAKPIVGIFGLTGCAGDQLVILNCEDELLDLAGALDIRSFHMAMSDNDEDCDLDIALVEGSVVQPEEVEMLERIRSRARLLIAIGTCAVWGGVQAMKNEEQREKLKRQVYGPKGKDFGIIPSQPLSSFVRVDYAISGCPIEKDQFLQAALSLIHGDLPVLPDYAVCTECKMRENSCLLLERGELCLGPITVAGCNARCPAYGQPCIGCRGPVEEANVASEVNLLREKGFTLVDIQNRLRTFGGQSEVMQVAPTERGR
ncbi:hypothetical protein AMJ71_05195 [candidate division TA06 bacterium SM1_40]|uniref:NADH:ubiquinone oxidoreductase-like 20kDa subunit domain-containing protein n=2 Tax=Bacteria division TA06 TaxID=1156500 RepID=A0A0S8JJK6_UNCT6|nr:MAG: hypothetical protein AMJ82_03965 [candidate division TA06 bacterium SM23_40]KPL09911.1 MAG: hypothetical protein AMJ71_05195 [candidate division TA06 bacterium SM1_40]